jgi:hypothetical protein
MNVKVHYRITQDRAGIPQDFAAARRFVTSENQSIEDMAKQCWPRITRSRSTLSRSAGSSTNRRRAASRGQPAKPVVLPQQHRLPAR